MSNQVIRDGILAGKTAFITGGTSGINLGIARRFVTAGAAVAVLGRKVEKAEHAVAELRALGGKAISVIADVRDATAMEAAFLEARNQLGELDILVCGAAGNFPAPVLGMSSNGFKAVMDIDVLGTFHACRFAFDHLRRPGASVVNISAPQAGQPVVLQSHVCAAKAGVDMLTKTLAMEWGSLGVRVNSIWPGAVEGTEGMARLAPSDEAKKHIIERLPLQRFAQPEDIAEMALFLCTPGASYVTGSVIVVDGGMSLVGMNSLL